MLHSKTKESARRIYFSSDAENDEIVTAQSTNFPALGVAVSVPNLEPKSGDFEQRQRSNPAIQVSTIKALSLESQSHVAHGPGEMNSVISGRLRLPNALLSLTSNLHAVHRCREGSTFNSNFGKKTDGLRPSRARITVSQSDSEPDLDILPPRKPSSVSSNPSRDNPGSESDSPPYEGATGSEDGAVRPHAVQVSTLRAPLTQFSHRRRAETQFSSRWRSIPSYDRVQNEAGGGAAPARTQPTRLPAAWLDARRVRRRIALEDSDGSGDSPRPADSFRAVAGAAANLSAVSAHAALESPGAASAPPTLPVCLPGASRTLPAQQSADHPAQMDGGPTSHQTPRSGPSPRPLTAQQTAADRDSDFEQEPPWTRREAEVPAPTTAKAAPGRLLGRGRAVVRVAPSPGRRAGRATCGWSEPDSGRTAHAVASVCAICACSVDPFAPASAGGDARPPPLQVVRLALFVREGSLALLELSDELRGQLHTASRRRWLRAKAWLLRRTHCGLSRVSGFAARRSRKSKTTQASSLRGRLVGRCRKYPI